MDFTYSKGKDGFLSQEDYASKFEKEDKCVSIIKRVQGKWAEV